MYETQKKTEVITLQILEPQNVCHFLPDECRSLLIVTDRAAIIGWLNKQLIFQAKMPHFIVTAAQMWEFKAVLVILDSKVNKKQEIWRYQLRRCEIIVAVFQH